MKLSAIICEVLAREACRAIAHSPHVIDPSFLPFGLHCTPNDLRHTLQAQIDQLSGRRYDAILFAYGLCSRGTADLVARDTRLVIPRAHDCITLLLGSQARYAREFAEHPGTYYYSCGWIERVEGEVRQGGIEFLKDIHAEQRYHEYVEKYGAENAAFLIEQESQWFDQYNRAVFVDHGLGDVDAYRQFVQQIAKTKGWTYEELPGSLHLLTRLMNGEWDPQEFLVVEPGQRTVEAVHAGIISVAGP